MGVFVRVAVGTTGVFVRVAGGPTGVLVCVAVGPTDVFVGVLVGPAGVFVGVFVGPPPLTGVGATEQPEPDGGEAEERVDGLGDGTDDGPTRAEHLLLAIPARRVGSTEVVVGP